MSAKLCRMQSPIFPYLNTIPNHVGSAVDVRHTSISPIYKCPSRSNWRPFDVMVKLKTTLVHSQPLGGSYSPTRHQYSTTNKLWSTSTHQQTAFHNSTQRCVASTRFDTPSPSSAHHLSPLSPPAPQPYRPATSPSLAAACVPETPPMVPSRPLAAPRQSRKRLLPAHNMGGPCVSRTAADMLRGGLCTLAELHLWESLPRARSWA